MINYDLLSEREKRKLIAENFELKEKVERLNQAIADFKKYDSERKEYINGIKHENKRMRDMLINIEGTPYNEHIKEQHRRQLRSYKDILKKQKNTINELLVKLNRYEANKTKLSDT